MCVESITELFNYIKTFTAVQRDQPHGVGN